MSDTVFIDERQAADWLLTQDNLLIVTHKSPDGDTLGSGFALWAAMVRLGRRARVACPDGIGPMYDFLTREYDEKQAGCGDFSPDAIVSVDVAAPPMLGRLRELAGRTDLSIDHHGSNAGYARRTLLRPDAASCAEIVYRLLPMMGVTPDSYIAAALYAGISTDTGCFLYRNTTADSHAVTAELIRAGIDAGGLNKILFETKTRAQMALLRLSLDTLAFFFHGRIAAVTVTGEMLAQAGASESDLQDITPLAKKIEGVEIGLTFLSRPDGTVKCSVRTVSADASAICGRFGGGGHPGAAGFECSGDLADVKALAIRAAAEQLESAADLPAAPSPLRD